MTEAKPHKIPQKRMSHFQSGGKLISRRLFLSLIGCMSELYNILICDVNWPLDRRGLGQFMWDLWWANKHYGNFSPSNTSFLCQYHYTILHIHSSTTHAVQCFSPNTPVFPCQYHSTIAPYSFIHLPPMQYNVFLPVIQVSSVSIIPPLLHTH